MTHNPICRECNQEPCVCARGVPATDLEQAARALADYLWKTDLKGIPFYLVSDLRAALDAEAGRVSVPREPTQETVDKWLDQGDAYMRELDEECGIVASDADWIAASYACTLAYAAGFKAGKDWVSVPPAAAQEGSKNGS